MPPHEPEQAEQYEANGRRRPPPADCQPAPPFEGLVGYWVERAHFPGSQSFGLYECEQKTKKGKPVCRNTWSSAHAQTNYGQGCRRCETHSKPWLMWYNTEKHQKRERKNPDDESAAHDRARCEACRLGVCTVGLAESLCGLAF